MSKLGSFCSAAFTIENRTNFDHCFVLVANNLGSCVLNTRVLGDSQSRCCRKAPWMEAERRPSGLDWRHRSPDHRSLKLLYRTRYTDCTVSKTISSRMKCYICHGCKRTLPLLDALLFVLLLSLLLSWLNWWYVTFFFQVAKFELENCWHQILQFWFVFWSLLNLEWLCREGGRPTTNHHCGNQGTSLWFQSKKNIYRLWDGSFTGFMMSLQLY
jgi:hypothetical protein